MHGLDAAIKAIAMGMIEVRPDGTVWRIARNARGKIIPQTPVRAECTLKSGYLGVVSRFDGRQHLALAHRLVWTVLREPIPPKTDINHLDGVKSNNHPENLELATRSENHLHAYRTKLRMPAIAPVVAKLSAQAKELRGAGLTYAAIAKKLNVSQTTAFRAVNA